MALGVLTLFGIIIVAAVIGLYLVGEYNLFVSLRNRFRNAFADLEIPLKQRYNLVPQMADVARRHLESELGVLDTLLKTRDMLMNSIHKAAANPGNPELFHALSVAESNFQSALSQFMVARATHPELRLDGVLNQLLEQLTGIENKIAFGRQAYNDSVHSYNKRCSALMSRAIASMFSFTPAGYFRVQGEVETHRGSQREAPHSSKPLATESANKEKKMGDIKEI